MKPAQTILYVEDDTDARELVTLLLTSEGYHVKTSELGYYAFTLALSGTFDLYVIDNYLPDITGVQLCQKIREIDSATPILFYSGSADSDIDDALAAGAQGFLRKPASVEQLLAEVKRLLAGALV
jgi:OmpR-family two-component system manganese-sensing response regulator